MYSLTPTYDLDSIGIQIPRPEIKVGHIFKYSDGTYHYGHLGVNNDVTEAMYFSLKIAKGGVFDSPSAVTLATTPSSSQRMNNSVVVKGYFSFNIKMHETPMLNNIRDLVPYENKQIKDVVTVKGWTYDNNNNAVLFLLLGFKTPDMMYALRLTGDIDSIGNIITLPSNSVVAVRGEASLTITEGT